MRIASPRIRARHALVCALALLVVTPASAGAISRAVDVVRDVPVATISGGHVTVDVWHVEAPRPRPTTRRVRAHAAVLRPVALLVHGGGWHTGDKRQWENSRWAQRLATDGWLVVNTNYRMACHTATADIDSAGATRRRATGPLCGHAMATSIADVRSALRFTAQRARTWGGDPSRIVVFGASAGGHLAMLAASDPARPHGVRAVVALSPPTDLVSIGADPALPITASALGSIGCRVDECPDAWRAASPLQQIRRGVTPPTWLFAAGADPITPLTSVTAYGDALGRAGIDHVVATTADAQATCHGPQPCAALPLAGSGGDLYAAVRAWLATRV